MRRLFVHLPPFERNWNELGLCDDDLCMLQFTLILQPEKGHVIPGTHGIRKIRWGAYGSGKRSVLRVFYADFPDCGRIYLITLLHKSETTDLTKSQQQILAAMMLELNRVLRRNLA